jgi:hypothetical protein
MAYPDLLGYVFEACFVETQLDLAMGVEPLSEIIRILCVTSYSFEIIAKVAISLDRTWDGIEFIHQGPEIIDGHIEPPGLPLRSAVIVEVHSWRIMMAALREKRKLPWFGFRGDPRKLTQPH